VGRSRQALDSKNKELQKSAARCLELENTVSSLRRDVHLFRMRCDRAEETRSREVEREVERAVERVRKCYESTETKRVKRPDGRIEDWVRDLVVELVVTATGV
jgi:chromosome segregation ATPase